MRNFLKFALPLAVVFSFVGSLPLLPVDFASSQTAQILDSASGGSVVPLGGQAGERIDERRDSLLSGGGVLPGGNTVTGGQVFYPIIPQQPTTGSSGSSATTGSSISTGGSTATSGSGSGASSGGSSATTGSSATSGGTSLFSLFPNNPIPIEQVAPSSLPTSQTAPISSSVVSKCTQAQAAGTQNCNTVCATSGTAACQQCRTAVSTDYSECVSSVSGGASTVTNSNTGNVSGSAVDPNGFCKTQREVERQIALGKCGDDAGCIKSANAACSSAMQERCNQTKEQADSLCGVTSAGSVSSGSPAGGSASVSGAPTSQYETVYVPADSKVYNFTTPSKNTFPSAVSSGGIKPSSTQLPTSYFLSANTPVLRTKPTGANAQNYIPVQVVVNQPVSVSASALIDQIKRPDAEVQRLAAVVAEGPKTSLETSIGTIELPRSGILDVLLSGVKNLFGKDSSNQSNNAVIVGLSCPANGQSSEKSFEAKGEASDEVTITRDKGDGACVNAKTTCTDTSVGATSGPYSYTVSSCQTVCENDQRSPESKSAFQDRAYGVLQALEGSVGDAACENAKQAAITAASNEKLECSISCPNDGVSTNCKPCGIKGSITVGECAGLTSGDTNGVSFSANVKSAKIKVSMSTTAEAKLNWEQKCGLSGGITVAQPAGGSGGPAGGDSGNGGGSSSGGGGASPVVPTFWEKVSATLFPGGFNFAATQTPTPSGDTTITVDPNASCGEPTPRPSARWKYVWDLMKEARESLVNQQTKDGYSPYGSDASKKEHTDAFNKIKADYEGWLVCGGSGDSCKANGGKCTPVITLGSSGFAEGASAKCVCGGAKSTSGSSSGAPSTSGGSTGGSTPAKPVTPSPTTEPKAPACGPAKIKSGDTTVFSVADLEKQVTEQVQLAAQDQLDDETPASIIALYREKLTCGEVANACSAGKCSPRINIVDGKAVASCACGTPTPAPAGTDATPPAPAPATPALPLPTPPAPSSSPATPPAASAPTVEIPTSCKPRAGESLAGWLLRLLRGCKDLPTTSSPASPVVPAPTTPAVVSCDASEAPKCGGTCTSGGVCGPKTYPTCNPITGEHNDIVNPKSGYTQAEWNQILSLNSGVCKAIPGKGVGNCQCGSAPKPTTPPTTSSTGGSTPPPPPPVATTTPPITSSPAVCRYSYSFEIHYITAANCVNCGTWKPGVDDDALAANASVGAKIGGATVTVKHDHYADFSDVAGGTPQYYIIMTKKPDPANDSRCSPGFKRRSKLHYPPGIVDPVKESDTMNTMYQYKDEDFATDEVVR